MRLPVLLTCAALAAGLTVSPTAVAAAPPATVDPTSGSLRAQVADLQAQVEAAGAELEAGARAWEQASNRLAVLTQQQFAVQGDLEQQDLATARSRTGVSALVRAAYKGGGLPPTLSALLSGDPRALSDLARVRQTVDNVDGARRNALGDLTRSRTRTARLTDQRTALRRRALVEQQASDARQQDVAARAAALAVRLTATADAMRAALSREAEVSRQEAARRAAQAARQAAERAAAVTGYTRPGVPVSYVPGAVAPTSAGACSPAVPHGYANGFLPDAVLCAVPSHPGHRLRTDAAQSFAALAAERLAAGLPSLCLTDSYRDYAGQVDVFARKPTLAAVPGRSQHGWGLALDLGCGAARFDSEVYAWLTANAPRFGWVNPAWAQRGGSKPEPWHWEFQG